MGSHPINLALRFLLELTAFVSLGSWGWNQSEGGLRLLLALGIPLAFAAVWGVFAVPDDPSRSGKAPVKTPGILRLFIELCVFASATLSLCDLGHETQSIIFAIIVFIHYLISYDRIKWLISK